MKHWMIVFKKRGAILLHLNEEYSQYKKLKIVDTKALNKLIKDAKNQQKGTDGGNNE